MPAERDTDVPITSVRPSVRSVLSKRIAYRQTVLTIW